jgi:hypothetical protein
VSDGAARVGVAWVVAHAWVGAVVQRTRQPLRRTNNMALGLLFGDLQGPGDELVGYSPCGLAPDGCACLRLVFLEN